MKEITTTIFPMMPVITNFMVMIFCLPRKKSLRFTFLVLGALIAANMVVDILIARLEYDDPFRGIRGLIYLPFVIYLFKGLVFQKIFGFFAPMTFTATLVLPCEMLARLFMRIGEFWYWLMMLVLPTIVLVAYNLVVWRYGQCLIKRLFVNGSEKEWSLYALSAVICYLVLSSIYPNLADYTGVVLLLIFFIFWSLIILCFAIINTHEKVRQKYEADLARDIISTGREYYGKLTDLTEQLHLMRHDYKHHLAAMQRMLASGNEKEMKEYLEKLNAEIDDKGMNEYCTSRVINALLDSFAERCKREKIEFSAQIILSPTGAVDDYELCIILGNLIENAITACMRTPEGERRYIELSMRPRAGQYGIKVENSFDGVLKHDGKTLFTTKTDGGLGIDSIKTVAARHNGEYIPVWDGHKFSAFTVLKY